MLVRGGGQRHACFSINNIVLHPYLLDHVHIKVYLRLMKRSELERKLKKLGWWFLRHGGNHDVWTNGKNTEAVPRHQEIKEILARKILRNAAEKEES